MNYHNSRRSPGGFRPGGHHRPFESPPARSPGKAGGFRSFGGPASDGFSAMGGEVPGEFGFNSRQAPSLSGQKRGFPFAGRGGSPDRYDGGKFAKLFVGSVPRTATEEDIRPLFEEHGNVIEVAVIKDKKTGQHQGCCFIKYATPEEADQAIRALHNQHTLPGGVGPIQVRYADGERERLGAVEYKLFVGALNKLATVKEVEEIFSKYGRVEDVYLMRDEKKQSRGCGFVKYSHRDMALAAINALNGTFTMRGCDLPLIVRFADPKRPRQGDSRGPAFGGPGIGPRFDAPSPRFPSHITDTMDDRMPPPNAWHPMHPPNMGPSSNAGLHGMGSPLLPRSGDMALPINAGGPITGIGGPIDVRVQVLPLSSMSQKNINQPMLQIPTVNQHISPLQKPIQSSQELLPSSQVYCQGPMPSSQAPSLTSVGQHGQPQFPLSSGPLPSQQAVGINGQFRTLQPQTQQQSALSSAIPHIPLDTNLQSNKSLTTPNRQQIPPSMQQQPLQPLQHSPSQLAQMLSQQTQTLQASFHSSQQAFSQLQQQLQMMQPSSQGVTLKQNAEATKQSPWTAMVPQAVASTPVAAPATDVPSSTSAASSVPANSQNTAPGKSSWTEHLSPEGFKYYYNSITGESRWEKPVELKISEQQSVQQPQTQSLPPIFSSQQVPQIQQVQPQNHIQGQVLHQQQMRQPSLSSSFQAYEATGLQNVQGVGYRHLQGSVISSSDPGHYSQGIHNNTTQEWMWNNKPTGSGPCT